MTGLLNISTQWTWINSSCGVLIHISLWICVLWTFTTTATRWLHEELSSGILQPSALEPPDVPEFLTVTVDSWRFPARVQSASQPVLDPVSPACSHPWLCLHAFSLLWHLSRKAPGIHPRWLCQAVQLGSHYFCPWGIVYCNSSHPFR